MENNPLTGSYSRYWLGGYFGYFGWDAPPIFSASLIESSVFNWLGSAVGLVDTGYAIIGGVVRS